MVKLKDICSKIGSGATPKGGKESYCEEGVSLIRSQNVLDYVFSADGLAHINGSQAEKLNNVIVEDMDVLLNITGDSVARVCMADKKYLPARVNQHVCIVRAKKLSFAKASVGYDYMRFSVKWIKCLSNKMFRGVIFAGVSTWVLFLGTLVLLRPQLKCERSLREIIYCLKLLFTYTVKPEVSVVKRCLLT